MAGSAASLQQPLPEAAGRAQASPFDLCAAISLLRADQKSNSRFRMSAGDNNAGAGGVLTFVSGMLVGLVMGSVGAILAPKVCS